MKKLIMIFFILVLLLSFLLSSLVNIVFNNKKSAAAKKVELPQIKLKNLNSSQISINKINQQTLLLFYLPQSLNCVKQLNILSSVAKKYHNELNIITIAIGNIKVEQIKKLNKNHNLNFTSLIDSKAKLTENLNISAIPTMVFYRPTHKIITNEGLIKKNKLQSLIKKHFKNPKNQ